jgi:hypothetical protein
LRSARGRGPRPARRRRRGRRSRCERPRGSQDRCLRRIRACICPGRRIESVNISSMYASPIARSASSPRFPSAALEEQSPIVLSRCSGILHVPGDVSNLPPHSADSGRGPSDDFELINSRSQSLLPLWPLVYDIVSWPPKLVFGAEAFERFSTVRLPRRMCAPLRVRRSLSPWRANSTS